MLSRNLDTRTIEGVASIPSPLSLKDIVEPTGARHRLPLPCCGTAAMRSLLAKCTLPRPTGAASAFGHRSRSAMNLVRYATGSKKRGRTSKPDSCAVFPLAAFRPFKVERRGDGSHGVRFVERQWLGTVMRHHSCEQ